MYHTLRTTQNTLKTRAENAVPPAFNIYGVRDQVQTSDPSKLVLTWLPFRAHESTDPLVHSQCFLQYTVEMIAPSGEVMRWLLGPRHNQLPATHSTCL